MPIFYGTNGPDSLVGTTGNDTIYGGPSPPPSADTGNDTLIGGAGRDSLFGFGGNDVLDGGADVDTLFGGDGDDIYVNPSGDIIDEPTGSGIDTIATDVAVFSINVIAGVENLTGTSATGQNLFGSSGNNVIVGSIGNDTLNGSGGNNTLDGGAGADSMSASTGNDTYVVDNVGDAVTETQGQGSDTIVTSLASYSLGANLENLTGTGALSQTLTGNTLANVITGGAGNDTIFGGAGIDTAVFSDAQSTYTLTSGTDGTGDWTRVTDNDTVAGGDDGTDRLYGVETLLFKDVTRAVTTVAPEISSIAVSGPGIVNGTGSLGVGKVVTFAVNASKAVTVTGAPTIALSDGATAIYTGGSGTTTLTFSHTVATGQNASDLAVLALNTPSGSAIRDLAGNAITFDAVSVGNPAGTLRIDTAAPLAPSSVALATDTGTTGDGITSIATIKGDAEAGSTVTLKIGSTVVGTGTTDATTGAFSITPISGLIQGANTITVIATDAADNASPTASLTFTYDTVAPTTTATVVLATDTGGSASDGLTANSALTGTAPANATLTIKDGATVVGTAIAAANGVWSFANGSAAESVHNYTVQVADAAGNLGPASGAITVTLDKTAPPIMGDSSGNSTLIGTTGPDNITAFGWNNHIQAGAGDDSIDGGEGNTWIDAGDGHNTIILRGWSNTVLAGDGGTTLTGPQGNTNVHFGTGDHVVQLGGYSNLIELGVGKSKIDAGAGNSAVQIAGGDNTIVVKGFSNHITTGSGNDSIVAGEGNAIVDSGDGNDRIELTGWGNHVHAGGGGDVVLLAAGDADGSIDGGAGSDTVELTGVAEEYRFGEASDGTVYIWGPGAKSYQLIDVEQLAFGGGAAGSPALLSDVLAKAGLEELAATTRAGVSTLAMLDLYAGPVEKLRYQLLGSESSEAVRTTASADFVNLLGGDDAVDTGKGDDVVDGGLGSNFITGGEGQDTFFLDGRGGGTTWSTITDWQIGEKISVWGWQLGISKTAWVDSDGAEGWMGATLHVDFDADGKWDASLTWTGTAKFQLQNPREYDGLLWFT